MKKALLVLAVASVGSSAFADGLIFFGNRNIDKAIGDGSTYNVPLWQEGGLNTPGKEAGLLAGGVTVGLFFNGVQVNNDTGSLAQSVLRTDAANAKFFATSSQTAVIPGVNGNTVQSLEIRAWQGASYQAAIDNGLQRGTWTFSSKVGGAPAGGGVPEPTTTLTGWGPESGVGLALVTPEPTTLALGALGMGALLLRRRK